MSLSQRGLSATLLLAIFLGAADLSLLAPGLLPIAQAFHVPLAAASWVVTLYAIVFGAALPVLFRVQGRYGPRRMFAAGGLLFAAGSFLAGYSGSLLLLLLGRGLQALAASALMPLAGQQVAKAFAPEGHGLPRGALGAWYGISAVVAAPLGGIVVADFGWRWLFLATGPLGLAVAVLAVLFVTPETGPSDERPDIHGAVLMALAVAALLLGVEMLYRHVLPLGWASLVFGVLLVPNLVLWERAAAQPIFRGDGHLVFVYLLGSLGAAATALALFVPLYAIDALRLSEATSGLALLPMALGMAATAYYGGALTRRLAPRFLLAAGFLGMACGVAAVANFQGLPGAIAGLLLVGGGVGLTMGAPLQYLVLGLAPKAQAGPARTLLGTFRALGLAIGPVVYAGMLPAFTSLFLAAGIIAFLGLAATLPLWGMRPRPNPV